MALFHTTVLDNQIKALPTVDTASGSIATFDTDLTENLVDWTLDNSATKITHCAINLFNGIFSNNEVILPDGSTSSNPSHKISNDYIVIKGDKVTLSGTNLRKRTDGTLNAFIRIAFYDDTKTFLSLEEVQSVDVFTVDVPNNAFFVLFQCGGQATNVQLEFGSSATTFNGYATTYNISDIENLITFNGLNNIFADVGDTEVKFLLTVGKKIS